MTIYGMVSKLHDTKDVNVDEYFTSGDLPDYLRKSDFICNVLPQTNQTDDLLSGTMLKNCMDRKSIFINVGRGNVIDESSIIEAIESKWIGGVVLDVFRTEPLPETSKLWNLPGVVITPHVSGLTIANEVKNSFSLPMNIRIALQFFSNEYFNIRITHIYFCNFFLNYILNYFKGRNFCQIRESLLSSVNIVICEYSEKNTLL